MKDETNGNGSSIIIKQAEFRGRVVAQLENISAEQVTQNTKLDDIYKRLGEHDNFKAAVDAKASQNSVILSNAIAIIGMIIAVAAVIIKAS